MSFAVESLLVATGGAFGALARFLLSKLGLALGLAYIVGLPMLTTFVNVVGCFLAGLALALLAREGLQESGIRSFIIVGFLGGFTTFSAFSVESLAVLNERGARVFVCFVSMHILVALAALAVGRYVGITIRS